MDLAATLSNPAAKGRDYIIYTCDEAIPEETAKRYFFDGAERGAGAKDVAAQDITANEAIANGLVF